MKAAECIPTALRFLPDEPNPAADTLLIEALPDMSRTAQALALDILLKRNRPAALATLVGRFPNLDARLKRLLIDQFSALHSGVRMAMGSPSADVRLGAVQAIASANDAGYAYLLADAVKMRCPRTREAAALTLREMAAKFLSPVRAGSRVDGRPLAASLKLLAEALGSAVTGWELHFQMPVLEAALWFGERTWSAITAKLDEPHSRLLHAISDVFAATADPRLAEALLRALAHPALRTMAAKALARPQGVHFYQALFRAAWLLVDPEVERGCRWVQEESGTQQWPEVIRRLPDELVPGAVHFLDVCGGSPQRRLELFGSLCETDRTVIRSAVVARLVENESPGAEALLTTISLRQGESAAEWAGHELFRRRLRHGMGEAAAKVHPSSASFESALEELFAKYQPGHSVPLQPEGGTKDVSRRFLEQKVQSRSVADRLKALRLIAGWNLQRQFADPIHACAAQPEAAVRAIAVGMLADLGDARSIELARQAIHDPDPRVQANAVEVLDRLGLASRVPAVAVKLDSPHQRVRANAVKALLRTDMQRSGEVLLDMLEDPSPEHRISALWVVERLRLGSILHRVQDLYEHDPDAKVRARAGRVLRELGMGAPGRTSDTTKRELSKQGLP